MLSTNPHNTKYLSGTQTYNLNCQDDVLNVDTSSGLITIVLPNIINNGLDSIPKRFYVNDVGGYASVNGITIVCLQGNSVNGSTSLVLSTNDISAELFQSSNTEWFVSKSSSGGGGGTTITVVANYSALPSPTTVMGQFYWCSASQGTKWLPYSLGGTYYPLGLYYSNGVTWEFLEVPYQSTQAQVDAGTNTDTFVTPNTFSNASKWLTKEDVANKSSSYTLSSTTTYANTKALVDGLATKQNILTNPITGTGTNNEIAYFNSTGSTISSLSVATYPNLTELSYVKGVTSAIQTQLDGKQPSIGYTAENVANKSSSYTLSSTTTYANTKALVDGLATKQDTLGYTAENVANKSSSYTASSTTTYANTKALVDGLATKQNTLTNPILGTGTNNEIAYFNSTGSTIASLPVATYPNLTELSYVKGVTSAIQTQLNAKLSTTLATGQIFLGVGGVATASSNPRAILNSMLASDFVIASTTSYYQPASAQVDNTTESNRRYYVNNDGLCARLLVQTASAQNSSGSCVVSINKNGVASGISITISASSVAGVFTDYVNSVSLVAGDYLTIKVVNNATSNSCAFTQISLNLF